MEEKKKYVRWLYEQLPLLKDKGIISAEQAEAIRDYYGPVGDKPNWATTIIAILGALLIGGGIILIFAYNWDDLSRAWRTVLSFAPLVLGQLLYAYAFFRRSGSPAWVEGASTFLFLMIGACIALISQTYHIAGELDQYLLSWALLSIPLLYLMNASLPALLYLVGIAWWVTLKEGLDSASVYYWGLLAAAVPHLIFNLRPERSPLRRNVLGWGLTLTLSVAWWWVIEPEIRAYSLVGTALLLSSFYLLGRHLQPERQTMVRMPFRTVAIAGMYIFLLVLTFRLEFDANTFSMLLNGLDYDPWAARINLVVLVGLSVAYIYLFLTGVTNRGPVEQSAALFPFVIIFYVLIQTAGSLRPAMVLANLGALGFGVAFLVSGFRDHHMGRVNIGLLFILLLAAVRFFDTDWSYVVKGVAFVLLGIVFLGANWVFSKEVKGEEIKNEK